jgi:hypothetical protein
MAEKPLNMMEDLPQEARKRMEALRNNLLICLIKRAGGRVQFPVDEVDAADDLLTMTIDDDPSHPSGKIFTIETKRRQ